MKKYYLLLLAVLLAFTQQLQAGRVSVSDAQNVAVNFFKVNASGATGKQVVRAVLCYTRFENNNAPDFYVFNMEPVKGFVIVSATDNVKPVLAYSDEAAFALNFSQTGIANWMVRQATHVSKAVNQNLAADANVTALWSAYRAGNAPAVTKGSAVSPMVKTAWNQEPYYNAFCPYNNHDAQQTVTGCVATAMAQIMKYWNYPYQGTGQYSYVDQPPYYKYNYGRQSADFGSTVYDWSNMPSALQAVDTPIATLMYQCGVSVAMDYGDDNQDGSGAVVLQMETFGDAPCAQNAFGTYFGYDASLMQGAQLSNYNSAADWLSMIEAELNAGRPILYEGTDPNAGGHAWVADGYNNSGVHMNWGWGGPGNGYYDLTNLDPLDNAFNQQDAALIGIQPVRATVQTAASSITLCHGDTTSLVATSSPVVTYTWTPATGLSCPTCASTKAFPTTTTTYTVKVDSSGYLGSATVTVMVDPELSASIGAFTNAKCYGETDGAITLKASGGTPDYSYAWSNGDIGGVENNLTEGTYQITITDAAGCSQVVSQSLTSEPQIIVTPQTVNATGCTLANGSATLVTSGGSGGGFTYLWGNGDTNNSASNLKAGTYLVTVTDSASCSTVANVTIGEPYQIQITVDVTNASTPANGSVTIANVTEGIAPYTFVWSNGDTGQDISNLAAGKYTVTVTDQSGCFETASAQVNQATAISKVNDAFSFSVYPNPANGSAYVSIGSLSTNTTLKFENILGQTLLTKNLSGLQTQLDLSPFPSGVYLLDVKQGDKRAVKQLVISR